VIGALLVVQHNDAVGIGSMHGSDGDQISKLFSNLSQWF